MDIAIAAGFIVIAMVLVTIYALIKGIRYLQDRQQWSKIKSENFKGISWFDVIINPWFTQVSTQEQALVKSKYWNKKIVTDPRYHDSSQEEQEKIREAFWSDDDASKILPSLSGFPFDHIVIEEEIEKILENLPKQDPNKLREMFKKSTNKRTVDFKDLFK